MESLRSKFDHLKQILRATGRLAVAFSGGADSSFLLRASFDVHGNDVLAVTAVSETTPRQELKEAVLFARGLGVRHLRIPTRELDLDEFVANTRRRCYVCKKYRFEAVRQAVAQYGFHILADGEHVDDADDFRPGRQAAGELGIRHPLAEAGLTRTEIRTLSKQLGLPTWNRPSSACLASRIPYGSQITAEKLRQIDEAEEFVRHLHISGQVRVRHEGATARIETDAETIARLASFPLRHRIVQGLKSIGFQFVSLDLEGYRIGSLNEISE